MSSGQLPVMATRPSSRGERLKLAVKRGHYVSDNLLHILIVMSREALEATVPECSYHIASQLPGNNLSFTHR